ncbi:MAG: arginine synthesis PII-interacting regulator PirA [Microcoleaceae cyanobacterium]
MNKNRESAKINEVHRVNIQKRLEHRLEVARTNGNSDLVRTLEAEMKQVS